MAFNQIKVQVEGLAELETKLKLLANLPKETRVYKAALRFAAQPMIDAMKSRLRRSSATSRWYGAGSKRKRRPHLQDALRMRFRAEAGLLRGIIGFSKATAWVANFMEFGTKPHVIKAKGTPLAIRGAEHPVWKVQHPGQPPRPFLRPAFDTQKGQVIARFKQALAAAIAKLVKA